MAKYSGIAKGGGKPAWGRTNPPGIKSVSERVSPFGSSPNPNNPLRPKTSASAGTERPNSSTFQESGSVPSLSDNRSIRNGYSMAPDGAGPGVHKPRNYQKKVL